MNNRLITALSTATCLVAMAMPAAAEAQTRSYNIPAGSLRSALSAYVRQSGRQVIYRGSEMQSVQSRGVRGSLTQEQALDAILAGTGFSARSGNSGAVAIYRVGATRNLGGGTEESGGVSQTQVATASTALDSPDQLAGQPDGEIVVTAQKRSERLQDVPVPVTAISGERLISNNSVKIQDFFSSVPGFSLQTGNTGAALLTIRGITTGAFTTPTVGVIIDDIPFGPSTGLGGGGLGAPDLDPSDLARVEVLRGPQGTLYGASSMGGLLKFVTVDPSTRELSGQIQAGISDIYNGHGQGFQLRGAVNVPVAETVALRASGFFRRDPGYIDNIRNGARGVNEGHAYGGRVSALWRPTDNASVKLSALIQDSKQDGGSYVYIGPTIGDLQQDTVPDTGQQHQRIRAYSGTVNLDLGSVNLVSLTGYSFTGFSQRFDYSNTRGALTLTRFGTRNTILGDDTTVRKFSQEVRLDGHVGSLDWLAGGFYTHERSSAPQYNDAVDNNGRPIGRGLDIKLNSSFEEIAGFADLTYNFSERFNIQVGARESFIKQHQTQRWDGIYVRDLFGAATPVPLIPPPVNTKDDAFTYLVTPQFKIAPNVMIYARFASGYRAGGPNSNSTINNLPTFKPDRTRNYEIGFKGDLLDRAVSVDASLYHIDWTDIQIQLIDPVTRAAVYSNASKAKSEGFELALTVRPWKGMQLAGWYAYNDAVLSEPFPASATVAGAVGDRLPMSSRHSANVSADQRFAFSTAADAHIGGSFSYVGDRYGPFRAAGLPRQFLPHYTKIDLNAGVDWQDWSLGLYVNNLADKRGLLRGGLQFSFAYAFYYIQPRTIGAILTKRF